VGISRRKRSHYSYLFVYQFVHHHHHHHHHVLFTWVFSNLQSSWILPSSMECPSCRKDPHAHAPGCPHAQTSQGLFHLLQLLPPPPRLWLMLFSPLPQIFGSFPLLGRSTMAAAPVPSTSSTSSSSSSHPPMLQSSSASASSSSLSQPGTREKTLVELTREEVQQFLSDYEDHVWQPFARCFTRYSGKLLASLTKEDFICLVRPVAEEEANAVGIGLFLIVKNRMEQEQGTYIFTYDTTSSRLNSHAP